MATGSLVLKISADLADFTKQLSRMTKQVDRAANQVAEAGKKLSLGITLPVTLAGAALLKMAADNEAAAASLERSFGGATEVVQKRLDELMKTMPVAGTELQRMATHLNDTATNLGLAAPAAQKLSLSVLQLANDLSAYARVPVATAVDAVGKAVQGEAAALKQLGITLNEAQVKQEAYRLGLLKTGQELSPLGKGLATYSLLVQRAGEFTGEAARRKGELGRKAQLMWRDVQEVADRLATRLIPAFHKVIGTIEVLVGWVTRIPTPMLATAAAVAAVAAAIGPAMVVGARLVQVFVTMKAAVALLAGANGIGKLVTALNLLTRSPAGLALIGIAAAAGLAYLAYHKFAKSVEESNADVGKAADELAGVNELIQALNGNLTQTGVNVADPIRQLQQDAQRAATALEQVQEMGGDATLAWMQLESVQDRILTLYDQQTDKLGEQAVLLQGMVLQFTKLQNLRNVSDALSGQTRFGPGGMMPLQSPGRAVAAAAESADLARLRVAANVVMNENQLRMREAAVEMIQVFPKVRLAAVELKEGFIRSAQEFQLGLETLRQSWQSKNVGKGIASGMQDALQPFVMSLTPASLAAAALGQVLRGLQPVFDALSPPLVAMGRVIGIMVTPVLRAIFPVLKVLGAAAALLGEIMARVSAGIATGIGRLLVGIGKLLNRLPGSIGNPAIRVGRALLNYASDQYDAASELKKARREIMAMKFGETGDAVDALGEAARNTAEALLNVPTGFRIALAQYQAQIPFTPGPTMIPTAAPPPPPGGNGGGTYLPTGPGEGEALRAAGPMVVNLVVDGKVLARTLLGTLQPEAQRRFGSTNLWAKVQAI